jgi:Tol biopolymer transport system component
MVVIALLVLAAPVQGQVIRQITDFKFDRFGPFAIDDEGSVVFSSSPVDQFGMNPQRSWQLIEWTFPGPVGSQVGSFDKGVAEGSVSVTDDGTQVVFLSRSDPLSQNHDASLELFLMMADGTGLVQLTDDPAPVAGFVHSARISGVGNRVVYLSNSDPEAMNPDHLIQLFLVETATLEITQLTTATAGAFSGFTITDDGSQVVFAHDGDLTGGNADGTFELFLFDIDASSLSQITDSTTLSSREPRIAGNGSTIVFERGGLYTVTPGGTPNLLVSGADGGSITDDGKYVYCSIFNDAGLPPHDWEIWVYPTGGAPPTRLTSVIDDISNYNPVVSGGNNRVVFEAIGGEYAGGNNPDGWLELHAMDADGSSIEQLTVNTAREFADQAVATPDGSRVVFTRDGEIFRIQSDGSDLVQITTGANAHDPSVTGDGSTIIYSWPSHESPIFQIQADGTGPIELTPDTCDVNRFPVVASGGSIVVWASLCDLAGENSEGAFEFFGVAPGGGAFTQITNDEDNWVKRARVSADGQWVAYHSWGNPDGLNPDEGLEVQRIRTDGTARQRLTMDPVYRYYDPDISGDGERVAYVSETDPLGTNADHNFEIFLYDADTSTTRQLTITSSGSSSSPRISIDGEYVYFGSTSPFFEESPGERFDTYRVAVGTGVIERVGGLRLPGSPSAVPTIGSSAVLSGWVNSTGENPDLSSELWLVDFATPAKIHPSKATPTLVTWDVEPQSLRYDVIRGDVADLQAGPANTVDLGPVVCLEDDSPDATTLGFEDPNEPAPGQAFFFLYRGSQGIDDGPGSWGQGSGDADRIAGAGSCLP